MTWQKAGDCWKGYKCRVLAGPPGVTSRTPVDEALGNILFLAQSGETLEFENIRQLWPWQAGIWKLIWATNSESVLYLLCCLLIARKLMIQYGMLRLVLSPSPHPPASRAPPSANRKEPKKYQGDCLISASEISDKPSRNLIHIQHSKWLESEKCFQLSSVSYSGRNASSR